MTLLLCLMQIRYGKKCCVEASPTSKLKPVTDAKEVAMVAPPRGRVPRWPTNITEIVCRMYCKIPTEKRGTANFSCLFSSSTSSLLFILMFSPSICCLQFSSYNILSCFSFIYICLYKLRTRLQTCQLRINFLF